MGIWGYASGSIDKVFGRGARSSWSEAPDVDSSLKLKSAFFVLGLRFGFQLLKFLQFSFLLHISDNQRRSQEFLLGAKKQGAESAFGVEGMRPSFIT